MRVFCEDVYVRGYELSEEKILEMERITKEAYLYKIGGMNYCFCLRHSFEKKGMNHSSKVISVVRIVNVAICIINVVVSAVTFYYDQ